MTEDRRSSQELADINKRLNALEYSQGIIINKIDNMVATKLMADAELSKLLSRHQATLFGSDGDSDGGLVSKVSSTFRTLTDHVNGDYWFYGIVITFLGTILGFIITILRKGA